jgi:hypothetical protein
MAIDATDPDRIWLTLSGADKNWHYKVYRSTDGGQSFENISDSLPDFPVNAIEIDHSSAYHDAYIGTDLGVFQTNDTLTSSGKQYWIPFNNGLPYCIVTDLQIDYITGKLMASTFGRGFWENDCPSTIPCDDQLLPPLVISDDTTWSSYVRLMRNVEIDSGAT